eukprot:496319-Amphidinium_carterae.1
MDIESEGQAGQDVIHQQSCILKDLERSAPDLFQVEEPQANKPERRLWTLLWIALRSKYALSQICYDIAFND